LRPEAALQVSWHDSRWTAPAASLWIIGSAVAPRQRWDVSNRAGPGVICGGGTRHNRSSSGAMLTLVLELSGERTLVDESARKADGDDRRVAVQRAHGHLDANFRQQLLRRELKHAAKMALQLRDGQHG
jgi:hypothetical protein